MASWEKKQGFNATPWETPTPRLIGPERPQHHSLKDAVRSDKTDFIFKTQRVKTKASTHVSRPTNLEGSFEGHTSKSTHSVSDNVKSSLSFPGFIFELSEDFLNYRF